MKQPIRSLAGGRVFYGWYVIAVVSLAFFLYQVQIFALPVFLKPMAQELGWSRSAYAGVQTVNTLIMGLLALFLGPLIDRRGVRGVVLLGALVSGSCLIALSQVKTLGHFYLIMGLFGSLGMLGMGELVVLVAVSNWFSVRRGRAMAVAGTVGAFGGAVGSPLAQSLIYALGWRGAWVALGLIVWLVAIPPALLFRHQHRPEELGLRPDGLTGAGTPADSPSAKRGGVKGDSQLKEVSWTRRQALGTPTLWLLIIAFGSVSLGTTGMVMHFFPFITDLGYSPGIAAAAVFAGSVATIGSRPFWGLLFERGNLRLCAAGLFFLAAATVYFLPSTRVLLLLMAARVLYGLSAGGRYPVQELIWAGYFGRLTVGAIRSLAMPFTVVFGALGPFLGGYIFDITHSYTLAFLSFASLYLLAAIIMLFARPPRKRGTV